MTDFWTFAPVLSPVLLGVGILLMVLISILPVRHHVMSIIAIMFCLAIMQLSGVLLLVGFDTFRQFSLVFDTLSLSTILLLSGLAIVFLIIAATEKWPSEAVLLAMFALLGMFIMVAADSLLAFYVGLELQSLALYVMIAIHNKNNPLASEAALKYFILGALSSALMLFGISLMYGQFGTVEYSTLQTLLRGLDAGTLLWVQVATVLILVGFLFKLSLVPFHIWTPDVYQGSPTTVVAFLSSLPKVAAVVALIRLINWPLRDIAPDLRLILEIIAALSMAWGALAGLKQTNLRRLLAYSTIAQMGFVLMGIAVATAAGVSASLSYITVYAVTSLGLFTALRIIGGDTLELSDITGLAKTSPTLAYTISILILSLAGMPFFAGFFTKLAIFESVLKNGDYAVVVVAVLSSVIAMYYYLKVIKVMLFDEPQLSDIVVVQSLRLKLVSIFIAVIITVFFISIGEKLLSYTNQIAHGLTKIVPLNNGFYLFK